MIMADSLKTLLARHARSGQVANEALEATKIALQEAEQAGKKLRQELERFVENRASQRAAQRSVAH